MILVADSGSTKTNWLTTDGVLMETMGFNPFFHSTDAIYRAICEHDGLYAIRDQVTKIYFYGAGCSSDERNLIVKVGLQKVFSQASIMVDHDLKAAALATYDGRKCIACILGTGSNTCIYDGLEIHSTGAGLGYILGDEASGSYFGRKLLSAYLYGELPETTYDLMRREYSLTKEKILSAVYHEPHANVYMASFAKVLSMSSDKAYIDALLEEGFRDFFRHHVIRVAGYQQLPVHFVGSIAFHFKPILQRVADEYGCTLGVVDKQPVYKLLTHHQALAAV